MSSISMSRRRFVQTAGSSFLAAPWIIPSVALGKDGVVPPSEKMTAGAIGVGGQGRGLLRHTLSQDDVKVLAVCDVDAHQRDQAKGMVDSRYENKDCQVYSDFRDLLAREDIDMVVIASPDHWHAMLVTHAAAAGKDIYCEKPLSHDLAEGKAMVRAVRRHGVVFQTGSMQRSSGRMKQACEIVRNGYLGKIAHIHVGLPNGGHRTRVSEFLEPPQHLDYDFYVGPALWAPYHPQRCHWNWRWWMGFGGGQMMDWIGHHGDIAHMGMGYDHTGPSVITPVIWDVPSGSNIYDAPAAYRIECAYENGPTLTVASRNELPEVFRNCNDTGTQWFGEDGEWLFVSRGSLRASSDEILQVSFKGSDFRFPSDHDHMRQFLNCVKTRQDPIAPVEAGHRSASIGHLAKIASLLGRRVKWDPVKEEFIEDAMANQLLSRPYRGEWALA